MKWIILIFLFAYSAKSKPIQYAEEITISDCVKEGKITLELEDRILIVPIKFDCKFNREF